MCHVMSNIKHFLNSCENRTFLGAQYNQKTSVIITFHENEKVSRILHTVHSILQRTPPKLLLEIILIDDHSTKGERAFKQSRSSFCYIGNVQF